MDYLRKAYPEAIVLRQGKSKFPDIWLLIPGKPARAVECKYNRYLDKTEKMLAAAIISKGFRFSVAYRGEDKRLKFEYFDGGEKEDVSLVGSRGKSPKGKSKDEP